MCGIVGYIGHKDKIPLILDSLRHLEYRGYDSAGLGILQNSELLNFKSVGKVENLVCEIGASDSFAGFGLAVGHTRWATHGVPSKQNAHPHSSPFSMVVHNGIIENHGELRSKLESEGFLFNSQTDTEVVLHLFDSKLQSLDCDDFSSVYSAFLATISELKGTFAILLLTKFIPDRIFYAKFSSPLIVGKGDSGVYFSSSDSALFGKVDKVCYLEDGAVGSMSLDSFKDLAGVRSFDSGFEKVGKDGFRFFMEKEIYEQESSLVRTISGRLLSDSVRFEELSDDFFEPFSSILICACGTSYNAALAGKYIFQRKAGVRVEVEIASEFRYSNPILKDQIFVVCSQSGETADTLEALKLARSAGLRTLAVCNVENSSITRLADCTILTRAGLEKGVASTKAFSTQVMVFWLLALYLGRKNFKIDAVSFNEESRSILNCTEILRVNSALHQRIKRLSKRYLHGHGFFFIGRDVFYPLALEGALKLKEISYLHAEGYPAGEMKHGPIALADSELFTLALMPVNLLYEKIKSNVEELCARDSTVCAISSRDFDLADDFVRIEQYSSYMEEFYAMMLVLQLLAMEIGIKLGNDVDMPRNLAKSVTVE